MKKRIAIFFLLFAAMFALAACTPPDPDEPDNDDHVVLGNPPENGGDDDEVTPVATPEVTPDPTPPPEWATRREVNPVPPATASEWASRIRVGWSLGNQFDAHATPATQARNGPGEGGFSWISGGVYANTPVHAMEGAWVSGATVTPRMINNVWEEGFNAIRIPVTWYKAADENYTIREDWFARVREVVDMAVANEMYIILNSHHDEFIFPLHDPYIDEAVHALTRIWEQIAEEFKEYDNRLAFQGLNEPRTRGSQREWEGGTAEERANLNILNQTFVNTVRASGGNNAERVLLVPTYAAAPFMSVINDFVLPTDTVEDRLIVALQFYVPHNFALNTGHAGEEFWTQHNPTDVRDIHAHIDRAYNLFVSEGIPVVITEMGAINRDNIDVRAEWAEYFVSYARSKNIPCFWWDSGTTDVTVVGGANQQTFGIFNRATGDLIHRPIVEGLLRGTW
jgi:endoglucanase